MGYTNAALQKSPLDAIVLAGRGDDPLFSTLSLVGFETFTPGSDHDTTHKIRSIECSVAGNVVVNTPYADGVTIALLVGIPRAIRVTSVTNAGTTATGILLGY